MIKYTPQVNSTKQLLNTLSKKLPSTSRKNQHESQSPKHTKTDAKTSNLQPSKLFKTPKLLITAGKPTNLDTKQRSASIQPKLDNQLLTHKKSSVNTKQPNDLAFRDETSAGVICDKAKDRSKVEDDPDDEYRMYSD